MSSSIQISVNGLAVGIEYGALLLGLLLIYQATGVVNFAHGQVGMISGLTSYHLIERFHVPSFVGVLAAIVVGAVLSALLDLLVLRRINLQMQRGADIILTLGLFLLLSGVAQVAFGVTEAHTYPPLVGGSVHIGGAFLLKNTLVCVVLLLVLFLALFATIRYTRAGMVLRASSEDPAMTGAHGWNVARVRTVVWLVAGGLGGLAGVLVATQVAVDTNYMVTPLIYAFVAGVLGGFSRIFVPMSIAVGIGLFSAWVGIAFGIQYQIPSVYIVAIVVLSAIPTRWLARSEESRA